MTSSFSLKRMKAWFASWQPLFMWYRHYKLLFLFSFFVVLGFGGWAWYQDLYWYSWSDEQKKEFLDTYAKETSFKESKYRDTVARLERLAERHLSDPAVTRNIFTGKDIPTER
jgi:hypothetical protein